MRRTNCWATESKPPLAISAVPDYAGGTFNEEKLFQYRFPTPLWDQIRLFIKNFANLPVWINKELAATVFGGKQNYNYWQIIFDGQITARNTGASRAGQLEGDDKVVMALLFVLSKPVYHKLLAQLAIYS